VLINYVYSYQSRSDLSITKYRINSYIHHYIIAKIISLFLPHLIDWRQFFYSNKRKREKKFINLRNRKEAFVLHILFLFIFCIEQIPLCFFFIINYIDLYNIFIKGVYTTSNYFYVNYWCNHAVRRKYVSFRNE